MEYEWAEFKSEGIPIPKAAVPLFEDMIRRDREAFVRWMVDMWYRDMEQNPPMPSED
jgi:hypothetical protein